MKEPVKLPIEIKINRQTDRLRSWCWSISWLAWQISQPIWHEGLTRSWIRTWGKRSDVIGTQSVTLYSVYSIEINNFECNVSLSPLRPIDRMSQVVWHDRKREGIGIWRRSTTEYQRIHHAYQIFSVFSLFISFYII